MGMSELFRKRPSDDLNAASFAQLKPILERRFAGAEPNAFVRLWGEMARICGVDPLDLHEDDELMNLCPPPEWSHINDKMDSLVYLAMRERRGSPSVPLRTVGDLMDWMLNRNG